MEKRYQVFVSSTYEDLRVERQEVMQALLELDCIPAGMELFPAANEDQWTLIQKVIQECDYYIVITAGKYGSIGKENRSYTEMEYRYAVDNAKPVIAFLHKDVQSLPASRVESTDDGKLKLAAFHNFLKLKMCKFWDTPADLGSKVSRSLVQLIKAAPAVGWVRADQVTDAQSAAEILRLRKELEDMAAKLAEARIAAPAGAERLSQGDATYSLKFTFESEDEEGDDFKWSYTAKISWDVLFYDIGPSLITEARDATLRVALNASVQIRSRQTRHQDKDLQGFKKFTNFQISDHDFQTVKIQFIALGLMTKSRRQRSLRDASTYWCLTPFGDQRLTTLRAIPAAKLDSNAIPNVDDSAKTLDED